MRESAGILVSRTDRLGDVLMALPALDYLRAQLPGSAIGFACRPEFRSMLEPFLGRRRLAWVGLPAGFRRRAGFLRERRYQAGLFLNADASLLAAAWWARIPLRVGAYSRPVSFLWLNRGARQRRSSAEKNEGRYGLDLAERLVAAIGGARIPAVAPSLCIEGDESSRRRAAEVLREAGVADGERFLVLHPGTGGTALNLSGEQYARVAAALERRFALPVLLSQGPSPIDRELVETIRARHRPLPTVRHADLGVVREVFRRAELVVGPSTGPLHLAHYVGTRTIGFYDPTRSQKPSRWGPWGGAGATELHVPPVDCPGTRRCVGPRCREYFCMARVEWADLVLKSGRPGSGSPQGDDEAAPAAGR